MLKMTIFCDKVTIDKRGPRLSGRRFESIENGGKSMSWQNFNVALDTMDLSDQQFLRDYAAQSWDKYQVYPSSLHLRDGAVIYLVREDRDKKLVVYGGGPIRETFQGETVPGSRPAKVCPLNAANALVMRQWFPFTAPVPLQRFPITVGLGDRLGIASPGHLRLLKRYPGVRPVLAQQSIRELNLTGRNYQEVLDAATWAVFQEDYQAGFGADGDHLKTAAEVTMALDCGFTMITLDCSEHIDNGISNLSSHEVAEKYRQLPSDLRAHYEGIYLNKTFAVNGIRIEFASADLAQTVLIYHQAIQHTIRIYREVIAAAAQTRAAAIDFEVSIDETLTPTAPQAHFLVANELQAAGVAVNSLAPRFCGEFQKGIDYRGDLAQFEREFTQHVQIAAYFQYKLSIHSGSDKFTVFPIIGRDTAGKFHLKTAGTNWLEAVRIVARYDPALFREMYDFAGRHLNEAKKYYHIAAEAERIPAADRLGDAALPGLLSGDDARQVLHITYGLILQAQDDLGNSLFKERFSELLFRHEAEYYQGLEQHIGAHLQLLGIADARVL